MLQWDLDIGRHRESLRHVPPKTSPRDDRGHKRGQPRAREQVPVIKRSPTNFVPEKLEGEGREPRAEVEYGC